MSSELDDWENWETPGEETGSVFSIKKQEKEQEKEIKEEIELTNQQSVNDLFKVKISPFSFLKLNELDFFAVLSRIS